MNDDTYWLIIDRGRLMGACVPDWLKRCRHQSSEVGRSLPLLLQMLQMNSYKHDNKQAQHKQEKIWGEVLFLMSEHAKHPSLKITLHIYWTHGYARLKGNKVPYWRNEKFRQHKTAAPTSQNLIWSQWSSFFPGSLKVILFSRILLHQWANKVHMLVIQ